MTLRQALEDLDPELTWTWTPGERRFIYARLRLCVEALETAEVGLRNLASTHPSTVDHRLAKVRAALADVEE